MYSHPALPSRGLGVQALCPSWSDRAGSPDPSRVLSCSSFLQSWSQQGEIQHEARAGDRRQAEKGRDVSGPRAAACFSDLGLGGGSRLGSAVPLCCSLAGDLPVRSPGQGLGSGSRMQAPPEQFGVSLFTARAQTTSGAKHKLCRGHQRCRTPPVPPSHSPEGLRPASCVEPHVLLAQVWGANAVGVPSKEVQGSFGAGVRSCSDAKGRLQVCRQPLPACRSRSWLESSGENCPSWCKEPGSVPVSTLGDAGHSHSTEILVPWVHYGTLGHTETPQDTGTQLPIASSLG